MEWPRYCTGAIFWSPIYENRKFICCDLFDIIKNYLDITIGGENMQTAVLLIVVIISILIYWGVQKGSMSATAKKFILGFLITIVIINIIMVFLM